MDQNGNINIRDTAVDLEPSGRQIDTAFSYTKDISEDFTFSIKGVITNEFNHIKDSDQHYSGYVGMKYKDLKAGISDGTDKGGTNIQLEFRKDF